jgi:hypothetical protein
MAVRTSIPRNRLSQPYIIRSPNLTWVLVIKKPDRRNSRALKFKQEIEAYLISLWSVWRLRKGLYFFFSMRSVTVFLLRLVR